MKCGINWDCVIGGRRRTHHSRGSSSNQFRARLKSFDIVGVMALSACGRLSVSRRTWSTGKPSASSSDTVGGLSSDDIGKDFGRFQASKHENDLEAGKTGKMFTRNVT